jgi:uncharacterized membrane protein YkvA (DUF1232 family)
VASHWWPVVLGVVVGALLIWVALIAALWRTAPDQPRLREMLRLLPDMIGLLRRLASDGTLPLGVRVRLWLLIAYLASPVDLVPDFIPIVGYADDAILVALALRSVTRLAGANAVDRHWRGTPHGLAAVRRLAGLR